MARQRSTALIVSPRRIVSQIGAQAALRRALLELEEAA
jgi:hypothetical protein